MTGTIDVELMRGFGPQAKPGLLLANPAGVNGAPGIAFGLLEFRLLALIGSFQACKVILKNFEVDQTTFTYRARLRYECLDHFGVDNNDVIFDFKGHGTDGQVAFWLLQHRKIARFGETGHVPFRYVVVVEIDITDTLLSLPALPLPQFRPGALPKF